jgi:hypothetical protein
MSRSAGGICAEHQVETVPTGEERLKSTLLGRPPAHPERFFMPLSGRCLEPVTGSRRFGRAVSFVPVASLTEPFERSEPRSRAIDTSMTQVLMDRFQTLSVSLPSNRRHRLRGIISKYGSRGFAYDQCRIFWTRPWFSLCLFSRQSTTELINTAGYRVRNDRK